MRVVSNFDKLITQTFKIMRENPIFIITLLLKFKYFNLQNRTANTIDGTI